MPPLAFCRALERLIRARNWGLVLRVVVSRPAFSVELAAVIFFILDIDDALGDALRDSFNTDILNSGGREQIYFVTK